MKLRAQALRVVSLEGHATRGARIGQRLQVATLLERSATNSSAGARTRKSRTCIVEQIGCRRHATVRSTIIDL